MATMHDKLMLLRGILDGKKTRRGPFYVTVELTRRCNMVCIGCRYPVPGNRNDKGRSPISSGRM